MEHYNFQHRYNNLSGRLKIRLVSNEHDNHVAWAVLSSVFQPTG